MTKILTYSHESTGEDLWHAYNIIRQGDLVTATTFRKISRDSGAGTQSEKVKIKLTVQIETVDFDAEGESDLQLAQGSLICM